MAQLTLKHPPKLLPKAVPKMVAKAEAEAKAEAARARAEAKAAAKAAAQAERQIVVAQREAEERLAVQERRRRETHEILDDLRVRWPDLFTKPVPLAVGIARQLRTALPAQSRRKLGYALENWAGVTDYHVGVAAGKPRRNLDGSAAGVPEEKHRTFSRKIIEQRTEQAANSKAGSPTGQSTDGPGV
jgi:hypothetical protein